MENLAFGDKRSDNDIFFYSTAYFTMGAAIGALATQNVQIDADGDFYWCATSYQADVAAAALTEATNVIPLVTVEYVATGSGRFLQNIAMPLAAVAGDGKRPYRFTRPRILVAQTTFQLKFVNRAAIAYQIQVVLHGYKRYANKSPV